MYLIALKILGNADVMFCVTVLRYLETCGYVNWIKRNIFDFFFFFFWDIIWIWASHILTKRFNHQQINYSEMGYLFP